MNPSDSKEVRIKVLQTHHQDQSVLVDYVFELPRKKGEYAVLTSSVHVTPSPTTELAPNDPTPEPEPTPSTVGDEDSIAKDNMIPWRLRKMFSELPGKPGLL